MCLSLLSVDALAGSFNISCFVISHLQSAVSTRRWFNVAPPPPNPSPRPHLKGEGGGGLPLLPLLHLPYSPPLRSASLIQCLQAGALSSTYFKVLSAQGASLTNQIMAKSFISSCLSQTVCTCVHVYVCERETHTERGVCNLNPLSFSVPLVLRLRLHHRKGCS